MPTLEQIAEIAQVSRSTVSRVINNDPNVSDKTRTKVLDVIEKIHFQPNMAARSLAGGRTRIIGVVIPTSVSAVFADPYFSLVIQGISNACNVRDHSIMLWLAEPEYERRTVRQVFSNKLLDGVIIASNVMDEPLLNSMLESDLPMVLIGRLPDQPNISFVDVDNQNSAREMVAYLLRLGYKRIGTITGPLNMIAGNDRLEGYKSALRQWNINLDNSLVIEGNFAEESGYTAMQRLLPRKPEAIFCASDAMAVGALRAIREAGYCVPGDISLASFDDMPFAARTDPPLTTVRQPIIKTGAVAAETLINLIEHPSQAPCQVILPTELVIRASCGTGTK